MFKSRATRIAVAIGAALLATISAVLVASAASQPRTMRYACASELYGVQDVLHYASRPSSCDGTGETLIDFKKQYPVYTCRKEHGTPRGIRSPIRSKSFGAHTRGPAGLMRLVTLPTQCKPQIQPNETPLTLPRTKKTQFCVSRKSRELRFVKKSKCTKREFRVVLPARAGGTPTTPTTPEQPPIVGNGNNGNIKANDDSASTDENTAKDIDVIANDTVPGPGNKKLSVASTDAAGTKGTISLNGDGTIKYDPNHQFENLGPGETATDTFKYRAQDDAHTSDPATVTVTVSGVNDAPVLSAIEASTLDYFEGSTAVPVTSAVSVADSDNANIASAKVKIASGYSSGHDVLGFSNQNGISSAGFNAASGELSLTGSASKADYQTALRSITFHDTGGPSGNREVSFQVDDGAADNHASNVVKRTVLVDKAPHAVDDTKTLAEDAAATAIDVRANDTDSDGGPKTVASKTDGAHGIVAITNGGDDLTYTPALNFCGSDSFTYTLNGGSSATVSVTVDCVNDAPVNTVPGQKSIDEDVPLGFTSSDFSVADVDAAGDTVTTDLTVPNGTIAIGGSGGTVTGNNTGSVHISGTLAQVNSRLDAVTYTPETNDHATRTLTITTDDGGHNGSGGAKDDTDTVDIVIGAVNDAPVNSVPGAQSTDEDTDLTFSGATAPAVSDIDSDPDPIKVTLTVSHGVLELASGSGVTALGDGTSSVEAGGTRSQINSALDGLKYTPDANFDGSDSLTVLSDDLGHNGSGGNKTDSDTVGITVGAVNDAPVNSLPGAQTTDEDTQLSLSPSVADSDAASSAIKVTFTVSHGTLTASTPAGGTRTGNGTASLELTGSQSAVNTALGSLAYTPSADYNGPDALSMKSDDQGNTGSGGAKTDTDSLVLTISAVNDAPVNGIPSAAQSVNEDTALTFSTLNGNALSTSDVDAGSDPVRIAMSVQHGALTLGGTSGLDFACGGCTGDGAGDGQMIFQGSLTDVNAALQGTTYQADLNFNGADFLSFTTADLAHNGSGGIKQDGPDNVSITVNAVNDAPTAIGDSFSVDEDTPLQPSAAAGLLDNDSDPDGDTITASKVSDPANGTVNVSADGSFTYTPNTNFNGSDSFTYKVSDGALDSNTVTVNITVNAVNDAPVNTLPGGKTVNEDNTLTLSGVSKPSIGDVDSTTAQLTVGVDHGTLTLNGSSPNVNVTGNGTGSVTATGPIADINTLLDGLAYTPASNYNGADTITFSTSDQGNTGSGGAKIDTDTIGVTVDPVNDAPVAVGDSDSTTEDNPVTTSVLGNDSDVDGDTLTPSIVSNGTNGTAAVNVGGTITYTPNANFDGSDSYTYKVNDGALDSNTVTVNITVGAINDAPVNSVPGTQTINEDSNLVLSGGNAPSFDDVDVGGSDATVTLKVTSGTLTLGSTPGTLTSVTGNGTGTVVVTGTKSDINTALAGLTYNPTGNFNGTDSISMKTEDNGNTGSGGNKSDTDSIQVNVTGVNDGPVNSVPASTSTNEDTPKTFSTGNSNAFSIGDIDSDPDDVTITLTATNGTATLNPAATGALATLTGDGTSSVSATGTVSELNAALNGLVFTPTTDFFGAASLELLTDDNGNNGTGGNLTDDDTVAITVDSVNDAPLLTTPVSQSTPEDTTLTLSPAPTVTDADSGADDIRVQLNVVHGSITLATTVGITSFSTGDGTDDKSIVFDAPLSVVNSALNGVKYTPDQDDTTGDAFQINVSDLGHNGAGGAKTDSDSTTITVGAVNDAPVVDLNGGSAGTGTNPTFLEVVTHDNSVVLAPSATVTDVDDTNIESATVTLTNRPDSPNEGLSATGTANITVDAYDSSTGVLFLHGSAPKSEYAQVLQTVAYSNTVTIPDATDRSVTFTVNDGNVDSASATSTVQVVPLNSPPVVDLDSTDASFDSSATFTEDSPAVNIAPNPDITDVDAFDTHMESATITLTNRPDGANESLATDASGTSGITVDAYDSSTGVLFLHGHGTIADYETLISRIKYDNSSQNPDTTDRDVTVVVNDGQANSITRHATVHVNRHNDPITNTVPGGQAFAEDTPLTFTGGTLISIADADAGSGAVKVTVSADHGSLSANQPAGGTRTGNSTHSLELTGTVSAVNTSLDGMTYTPDANYNGSDTVTVLSDDQGNSGGAATTDSDTIALTISAVNDAPSNTVPGSQSVNEDTALPFSSGTSNQISVSDVDAGANPIKVKLEVAHGSLTMTTLTGLSFSIGDGAGDPTMEFTGTQTDINAALNTLSYQGTLNYYGPDTLTVTTNDQGNSGTGGALQTVSTVGITVNPVNDAPSATADSYSTNEDTQLNVPAPGVLTNDSDIDSGSFTAVKVSDPANGNVTLNPDGSFTYDPNPNFNGPDSFTYKANDGSLDSNTVTVSLTVNAVNDAPSNSTPSPQTVDEDTTLTFNSGNGNPISTSDVDAGASQVKVTLAALHGGLTLSGTSGLSFACGGCAGDGSGDSTMTFTGTLTNVNAALNGASYLGTLNYNGPEQITLTVNDQGATGAGGAKQDSDVINVTVNPVNDNPVATDETFNATNSAIGNTTLNVNDTATRNGTTDGRMATPDPTDTSPTTDRPHKEITGDILANDTDVDNNNNEFTVTPGTFATNDGGTVTIQSDGDFNFEPAPSTSCTDTSDFFDYTVTDNVSSGAGPNPGTDTGRVTVAITGCVWYVNNNDAQGNNGTSEKPFDTTAQAQTASGNNQTTFVYDGDDTTTGYNTGYTMNAGESLLSEGATLTIGGDTLHTADAANKASLTNNNADVVTLAGAATVKSFNIDPQGTGGGIFGTGLGATTVTLDDLNVVDNGTKGTQPGLELDTNTGTTTNVSNLTVNNGDGSSATTGDTGVKLNNTGTVNFASAGTISITTNGAAGLVASGAGSATSLGSASTFDDITVTNSGAGGVSLTNTTGSGTAFGDGSGNDLQLTTVSGASAAFSVQTAGSFSVPAGGQSDVSATGGPAVDVVSSSGSTMPFDGVSSTNSANDGINIDGIGTGTFSATSGSIGGEAGIGFDLNGGSGAITYPGTFNNGTGPLAAEVTGRSGGVVSLSGSMNDTSDTGGGVNIASNTGGSTVFSGATKQYNTGSSDAVTFSASDGHTFVLSGGGSDIDTTSGNGINATTSGTFQVSGSGNTIDSTALGASNRGLNISDTDIAASDVTFDHINTSGGTNGIRLNNTGNSAGDFNVTGTGGTCTAADQSGCSGGVIQSASGANIELTSVPATVNLTRMNVKNGADDGIRATTVGVSGGNGIALNNSYIANNGNVAGERGAEYTNVIGLNTLSQDTFTGNAEDGFQDVNSSGTMTLNVTGGTYSNQNLAGVGNDGLQVTGNGTANQTVNVQGGTYSANRGDHIQVAVSAGGGTPTQDVTINNTTMTSPASGILGGGITISPAAGANVVSRVTNNNITGAVSSAINHNFVSGTGTLSATVTNNTGMTAPGADLIQVYNTGDQTVKALITGNSGSNYNFAGLDILSGDGDGSMNVTATGNTFSSPGGNAFAGIYADMGTTDPNAHGHADQGISCLDIGGAGALQNSVKNSFNAVQGVSDIRFRHRMATTVRLPGYTGASLGSNLLGTYLQGRNSGNGTPTTTDSASGTNGWTNTSPAGSACPQPTP